MYQAPFRRTSEASSTSDSPFISPDGHVGTDLELDNLPARLRDVHINDPRYVTKSYTSRSDASSKSATTNPSGSSSPSHYVSNANKGKARMFIPPPPISASIYGTINPMASMLPASKPTPSPSNGQTIASSTYRHVTFGSPKHNVADDALLILSQREQELQAEIQELLDAQSDGLRAGLGGGESSATESVVSDEGNTPTASRSSKMPSQFRDDKYSSMVVRPVRQPRKKKPNLRAARRGILRSINELASLKEEEDALVSTEISSKQSILHTIDGWEQKISGFQKAIEGSAKSEEARELQNLQSEKRAVDTEIHELETRLLQMHAKKRNLGYRISELQNRQEAGMSSYKEGLRLAERNVQTFLSSATGPADGTGFWALPRKRRTLGLARDHYTEELESSKALKDRIRVEGEALVQGAEVWAEAASEIMAWEATLRKALAVPQNEQQKALTQVLKDINILIEGLERKEHTAEEKGWKLLVVAIGAEIAYLKEGQVVLQNILGISDATSEDAENNLSVGTIIREDTSNFNESFQTAEGESASVINLKDQHHELSELNTKHPASPRSQSPLNKSGSSTPYGLSSSQFNGLRNSVPRIGPTNNRMTGSGSSPFKNGSLSALKSPDATPPLVESPPNGGTSSNGATPLGMSLRSDGTRSAGLLADKMTGSGRLTMSWRDKGKGKLGERKDSSTESEDEGPDLELLVGRVGDDVE